MLACAVAPLSKHSDPQLHYQDSEVGESPGRVANKRDGMFLQARLSTQPGSMTPGLQEPKCTLKMVSFRMSAPAKCVRTLCYANREPHCLPEEATLIASVLTVLQRGKAQTTDIFATLCVAQVPVRRSGDDSCLTSPTRTPQGGAR